MQRMGIKDNLPGLLAIQSFVVCVRLEFFCVAYLFLLSSPCFHLFFFSLLLYLAFLFLKANAEMDEDDRCWSFCAQPVVVASGGSKSDGHAGFGLCSFSLLLLMLYLEMTKIMAMKACYAGGAVALASVFSLLSTVSFLWFSLPCLSLVSSSSLPLLFFFTVMKGSKKEPLCSLVIHTILSSHCLFLFSFLCSLPFLLLSSSFLSCFPSFFFVFLFLFSLLPLGHQRGLIHSLIYLYLGKIQYINSRMQIPADLQ